MRLKGAQALKTAEDITALCAYNKQNVIVH